MPHNEAYVNAARQLGTLLAAGRHTVVYGGSNLGLMGVVSDAAMQGGGHVVGIIPTLFSETIIQSQQVSELIRVSSMAERKERIMEMCDAFVALPGGIGTIDEVSEVMVMNQLQIVAGKRLLDGSYRQKPMILLNIDGYYNPFLDQLRLIKEEGLMRSDAGLISADSLEDVFLKLNQIVKD
jgi:hypothetical protein